MFRTKIIKIYEKCKNVERKQAYDHGSMSAVTIYQNKANQI